MFGRWNWCWRSGDGILAENACLPKVAVPWISWSLENGVLPAFVCLLWPGIGDDLRCTSKNWLDVGDSGDSGVAGGRNCVVLVQSSVLWIGFIGVKCQCARVIAAETLGRGELGVVVNGSICLFLNLSVRKACDGLGVREVVISSPVWCCTPGAWNRRDVVPVLLVIVTVGRVERPSVVETRGVGR